MSNVLSRILFCQPVVFVIKTLTNNTMAGTGLNANQVPWLFVSSHILTPVTEGNGLFLLQRMIAWFINNISLSKKPRRRKSTFPREMYWTFIMFLSF